MWSTNMKKHAIYITNSYRISASYKSFDNVEIIILVFFNGKMAQLRNPIKQNSNGLIIANVLEVTELVLLSTSSKY